MIDRRGAEALSESFEGLRRECDFRDQHQRLFAGCEHRLDRLKVDFRFAAAGYAVQKQALEMAQRSTRRSGSPSVARRSARTLAALTTGMSFVAGGAAGSIEASFDAVRRSTRVSTPAADEMS